MLLNNDLLKKLKKKNLLNSVSIFIHILSQFHSLEVAYNYQNYYRCRWYSLNNEQELFEFFLIELPSRKIIDY